MEKDVPLFMSRSSSDVKRFRIDRLLGEYGDLLGRSLDEGVLRDVFNLIRLLDAEGVSPLLFFNWFLSGVPRVGGVVEFQLESVVSDVFLTMPLCLLDVVEDVVFCGGGLGLEGFCVCFDPFDLCFGGVGEFELLGGLCDGVFCGDVRYDCFLVVAWNLTD